MLVTSLMHNSFQLLRHKADVNFVNEHGNSALHYACFWGYTDIAEELIDAGALVAVQNKYQETPLDKCSNNVASRLHGKSYLANFGMITLTCNPRTRLPSWTRYEEARI